MHTNKIKCLGLWCSNHQLKRTDKSQWCLLSSAPLLIINMTKIGSGLRASLNLILKVGSFQIVWLRGHFNNQVPGLPTVLNDSKFSNYQGCHTDSDSFRISVEFRTFRFPLFLKQICNTQSNLTIRNGLIRNKLVLRNHYLRPICHLLHKDK